ncbi:MAG: hypothetical protein Q9191_003696, partial [Dirinaria sp. TL-2023a]
MANYYSQPSQPYNPQNLQFYPSSYPNAAPVSGHSTPSHAQYGSPQGGYDQPAPAYSGYSQGGYGGASSGFGGGGPAFGGQGFGAPSGRMGEQGGLRTGWLAAFGTEG